MNLVLINQLKETQSDLQADIEKKTSSINEAFEKVQKAEMENTKSLSRMAILE